MVSGHGFSSAASREKWIRGGEEGIGSSPLHAFWTASAGAQGRALASVAPDMELLPCVELAPSGPQRRSVIWLHGLGADGNDFPPIVPELGLGQELGIRWVFPHAPSIPVTLNGGMRMPAWYDIQEVDLRRRHDERGVRHSARQIEALIARERERGVPSERITLAGFSQGGAIAAHTALRHAEPLGALVLLSTYLVLGDTLEAEVDAANKALPIFQAHGTLDPMVPFERGEQARDRLRELGYAIEWREYPMAHQVCLEEIQELGQWLGRVLRQQPA